MHKTIQDTYVTATENDKQLGEIILIKSNDDLDFIDHLTVEDAACDRNIGQQMRQTSGAYARRNN